MATLAVGRVCMKIAGREAGRYCVVVKKIDDNFYMVTGPKVLTGVKRRRCNVEHLEPTPYSVKIEQEASDNAAMDAMEKEGLLKKLGLVKPSPQVVKEAEKPKIEEKKPAEKPKKEEKAEKPQVKEKKPVEKPKKEKKPKKAVKPKK